MFGAIFFISYCLFSFFGFSSQVDWNRTPTIEDLQAIRFKPVDPDVINHPLERRDFVEVPIDYDRPEGPKVQIFYRLIPSLNLNVDDESLPIMVVVNGGPGLASGLYQPYDFDYSVDNDVRNSRFFHLRKSFRILIIDQRGTDGYSAPLNLEEPNFDPVIIAKYFDSDEQARDHAKVIEKVIPENQPFYMIVQSYAGHIGIRYMTLDGIKRLPHGLIFASAALPHSAGLEQFLARRKEQRRLNLVLKEKIPGIVENLERLGAHFTSNGLPKESVNHLWPDLGKGLDWQVALEKQVHKTLLMNRIELECFVKEASRVNLLNYILSSSMVTPGLTDRILAKELMQGTTFEPWMIDETWTLMTIAAEDASWKQSFLSALDASPPPAAIYPSLVEIKDKLGQTQVLYTAAHDDAYLSFENQIAHIRKYVESSAAKIQDLPGGHRAIFLEDGYNAILEWSGNF